MAQKDDSGRLPMGWDQGVNEDGSVYFIDMVSGLMQSERPVFDHGGGTNLQRVGEGITGPKVSPSSSQNGYNPFIDPDSWEVVIETMAMSIHPDDQLRVFGKLKKIAEKMILKDDPKYRQVYLNNSKLQKSVLVFDGGLEFLYNLGFEPNPFDPERLVCKSVNRRIVEACLVCLADKVDSLQRSGRATKKESFNVDKPVSMPISSQKGRNHNGSGHARTMKPPPSRPPPGIGSAAAASAAGVQARKRSGRHPPPPLMNAPSLMDRPMSQSVLSRDQMLHELTRHQNSHRPNISKIRQRLGGSKFTEKVIVFIRHGTSIWNNLKTDGRKWQGVAKGLFEFVKVKAGDVDAHSDSVVVDAPLARQGIEEAYGLSRFLSRHFILRQFENLEAMQKHQGIATPIKDALRIIETGIFDNFRGNLDSQLARQLNELKKSLLDAHDKIESAMIDLQTKKETLTGNENASEKHADINDLMTIRKYKLRDHYSSVFEAKKTKELMSIMSAEQSDLISLTDEKDGKENENGGGGAMGIDEFNFDNDLPLEMEWVLDELIDFQSKSIVVCSNLRRAISTAIIALWDRFGGQGAKNHEKIRILPCLQELGMNVDTHTPILSAKGILPKVSRYEKSSKMVNASKLIDFYKNRLVLEESVGHHQKKGLRESTQDAEGRMKVFADWVFRQQKNMRTVIAVGHSHWMRGFFKRYLPKDSTHMATRSKIHNCGVVAFKMICEERDDKLPKRVYHIKPGSITPIYRGFQ